MASVVEYMNKRANPGRCGRLICHGPILQLARHGFVRRVVYKRVPQILPVDYLASQFMPVGFHFLRKAQKGFWLAHESTIPTSVSKQHMVQRPVNRAEVQASGCKIMIIRYGCYFV